MRDRWNLASRGKVDVASRRLSLSESMVSAVPRAHPLLRRAPVWKATEPHRSPDPPDPCAGKGSRLSRPCWQGARADAQGCEAGEEEEGHWTGEEEAAIQPAVRQRGCGCRQEARPQHAAARQDGLNVRACHIAAPRRRALCPRCTPLGRPAGPCRSAVAPMARRRARCRVGEGGCGRIGRPREPRPRGGGGGRLALRGSARPPPPRRALTPPPSICAQWRQDGGCGGAVVHSGGLSRQWLRPVCGPARGTRQ